MMESLRGLCLRLTPYGSVGGGCTGLFGEKSDDRICILVVR